MEHVTAEVLEAGLDTVRSAPTAVGRLDRIVRRPDRDVREVLETAVLDPVEGLVGDTWRTRGSSKTADGSAHPDMQLNVMNARATALVAGADERWALAGDQLYLDFDLSVANAPAGTRIAVGPAVIEVTAMPHLGCSKFAARYGRDALRFVNSPTGRSLRLRGLNARVVVGGTIRVGDTVRKLG